MSLQTKFRNLLVANVLDKSPDFIIQQATPTETAVLLGSEFTKNVYIAVQQMIDLISNKYTLPEDGIKHALQVGTLPAYLLCNRLEFLLMLNKLAMQATDEGASSAVLVEDSGVYELSTSTYSQLVPMWIEVAGVHLTGNRITLPDVFDSMCDDLTLDMRMSLNSDSWVTDFTFTRMIQTLIQIMYNTALDTIMGKVEHARTADYHIWFDYVYAYRGVDKQTGEFVRSILSPYDPNSKVDSFRHWYNSDKKPSLDRLLWILGY